MDTFRTGVLVAGLTFFVACTSQSVRVDPDQVSFDGLVRVYGTSMDEAWVRQGFEPAAYTKIMFRGAGIEYRPVRPASRTRLGRQTEFPISDANKARLEDVVAEEFRKELSQVQGYQIVDEPDPDTLLLSVGLTDVVSNVPPDLIGRYEVYLSEVGAATLVLEFRDSESGAVLVRAADRRAAERYGREFQRSSPVTNWPVIRRLAATWARGLRKGIEDMRTMNAEGPRPD